MNPVNDDALTRRITRWATDTRDVRVALLTSSRTIPNASVDVFSDHDVLLYVKDAGRLDTDDAWLSEFGDVLVQFRDPRVHDGMAEYSRLVLYTDGTKIDFTVVSVDHLRLVLQAATLPDYLDVGYTVLVDKDGLTEKLLAPTYRAHIPPKPTEAEYQALVQEFWWETTYVAKNLWRDELLQARYCFDAVMRPQLLRRMLEWYIETRRDWSWKPGVFGKGMKQALPAPVWRDVQRTFAGPAIEDNWRALFRMTTLFRHIAIEVATNLGFAYPQELDAGVTRYLEQVRQTAQTGRE